MAEWTYYNVNQKMYRVRRHYDEVQIMIEKEIYSFRHRTMSDTDYNPSKIPEDLRENMLIILERYYNKSTKKEPNPKVEKNAEGE